MTKVTVYARDNDKPGNREVVAFMREYLPQLVQAGLRFTFTIAGNEKELIARGIDKLPAIVVETSKGPKNFVTPVEIKSALLKFLGGKAAAVRSTSSKPEDELHDFYAREMNLDKYDEDMEAGDGDDGLNKKDIMARVQSEMERRQGENDKRGPAKPRQRGRRASNVREEPETEEEPERHAPRETRGAVRKTMTPRDRVVEAGGDPTSKDDAMLCMMMETSD